MMATGLWLRVDSGFGKKNTTEGIGVGKKVKMDALACQHTMNDDGSGKSKYHLIQYHRPLVSHPLDACCISCVSVICVTICPVALTSLRSLLLGVVLNKNSPPRPGASIMSGLDFCQEYQNSGTGGANPFGGGAKNAPMG